MLGDIMWQFNVVSDSALSGFRPIWFRIIFRILGKHVQSAPQSLIRKHVLVSAQLAVKHAAQVFRGAKEWAVLGFQFASGTEESALFVH